MSISWLLHLDRWGINVVEPATRAAPLDRQVRDALSLDLVDKLESPFFLYSHILAPHPPFTMDRRGTRRTDGGSACWAMATTQSATTNP